MADSQDQSTNQQEVETNGNSAPNDDRKLFVGGLSKETTEQDLRTHFGQYGEIESVNVKTDPQTGRSRGFAFIIFNSPESIDKVVAFEDHTVNGKKVDPKKAKARQGKIFVGGLSPETTDEEVKTFFEQFGSVVELEMPFDKMKNQRKGFCFITYESEAVVTELLKTPKQTVGGKEVDVKRATPKQDGTQMGGRGPMRGNMRGGRGGRGGFGGQRSYGQNWSGGQGFGGGYNQGGFGGGFGGGYGNGGGGGWGYDNYDYSGYGGGGYQGGKQRGGGGGNRQYQRPY
ncbi:RNA-binding protein squid-like [Armigeres subalbatus]|uniref:RNA-binding protein squid-like n=1 Tax=Armigeres subalbatus TaxID=124917 RepID=UPI002ED52077